MKYQIFKSSDTNVSKFVFEYEDPKAIAETVLYRYGSYQNRTVICCSVQSGCRVGCAFCGTGRFFVRNLTAEEIVSQVETALSTIDCKTEEIEKFQIMFMSMGEPFDNYNNLETSIIFLHNIYPNAQLLVSTSAPSSMLAHWADFISLSGNVAQVGIQFSVHESTDDARHRLIPTSTSTLRQMACLGELWAAYVGRKPFFNYCAHASNSTKENAEQLARLFNPNVWEATLSVICNKSESVKNSIDRQLETIAKFNQEMLNVGFSTRVFNPAGQDDIGGGCGQLWYFQEWLNKENLKSKWNQ